MQLLGALSIRRYERNFGGSYDSRYVRQRFPVDRAIYQYRGHCGVLERGLQRLAVSLPATSSYMNDFYEHSSQHHARRADRRLRVNAKALVLLAILWAKRVDRCLNDVVYRKVRAMKELDNVHVPLENGKMLNLRNRHRR